MQHTAEGAHSRPFNCHSGEIVSRTVDGEVRDGGAYAEGVRRLPGEDQPGKPENSPLPFDKDLQHVNMLET